MQTVKHCGGKVMVRGTGQIWGGGGGGGSLTVVEGRLNSEAYIRIIKRYVKKDGRKLVGRRFIFQQDRAPCHTQ